MREDKHVSRYLQTQDMNNRLMDHKKNAEFEKIFRMLDSDDDGIISA